MRIVSDLQNMRYLESTAPRTSLDRALGGARGGELLVRRQANWHQQVTVVAVIFSKRLVLTGNHGRLRRIGEGETNELSTENLQAIREVSGVVRNGDVITGQVRLQSLRRTSSPRTYNFFSSVLSVSS